MRFQLSLPWQTRGKSSLRLSKDCRRRNQEKRVRKESENSLGREGCKSARILLLATWKEIRESLRVSWMLAKDLGVEDMVYL